MNKGSDFLKYVLACVYICCILLVLGALVNLFFPIRKPFVVREEVPVYEYKELTEWQMLQMAIIKTESGFDEHATGKSEDRGIMQITPIYVREANRLQDSVVFTHNDAYDIEKSLMMFNIVQNKHNPDSSFIRAILNHNSRGVNTGYDRKVRENYEFIKNYEKVRGFVVNY